MGSQIFIYMQKHQYSDWRKFSNQLKETKSVIEDLSKLYIIIHEKVTKTLRNCTLDPTYNPTQQIQTHLQAIKQLLTKFAHRHQDQYLSKINTGILDSYEKHLYGLVQLLSATGCVQGSKQIIEIKQLKQEKKPKKTQPFSLKDQIHRSNDRRMRSRSGKRVIKNSEENQNMLIKDYDSLEQVFQNKSNYVNKLQTTKKNIEKNIEEQIEKKGSELNFSKKYNSIDNYLKSRQQFTALHSCQFFYNKLIEQSKTLKNDHVTDQKTQNTQTFKVFPEFNIKTKFMKAKVKQNILKAVFSAKYQLLQDQHLNDIKKMNEINEDGFVQLKQEITLKKNSPKQFIKRQKPIRSPSCSTFDPTAKIKELNKLRSLSKKQLRTTWYSSQPITLNKLPEVFNSNSVPQYTIYKY